MSHSSTESQPTATAITCRVESILPSGVFVRTADDRKYYIRRKELTLSGNKNPSDVVDVGQELRAVPIDTDPSMPTPEMSVRKALSDPWPEFAREHRVGDVVTGNVKYIQPDGVVVEIVPGVDGFVPLSELTTERQKLRPEDIYWDGDHLESTILTLDATHKHLTLSIRRRIEQIILAESLKEKLDRVTGEPATEVEGEDELPASTLYTAVRIDLPGKILVVEDREDIREPLLIWLREQGCEAVGAASGAVALELCRTEHFAAGIFDLEIPEINGVSLIEKLRAEQFDLPIAVMSDPELIDEQWPKLQPLGIVACFAKPLDPDEFRQTLLQISRGEATEISWEFADNTEREDVAAFRGMTEELHGEGELENRLRSVLGQLIDQTRAGKGMVFRLDPTSGSVTILAEVGQVQVDRTALYRLPQSPVKDVIRESKIASVARASDMHTGRWQNLEALIPFESCLGIPLEAGGRTDHALFLFAQQPTAFPKSAYRQALSSAYLAQALLESQILEQRLEAASGVLLSGQLSSAFGHEVFNKIQGLDLQMRNLAQGLEQLQAGNSSVDLLVEFSKVRESAHETVQTVADLRKTVSDFQKMMRNTDEQSVDVNQILAGTESQIHLIAQRKEVRVYLDLAAEMPHARVNSIRIQRVFLNLMLNAIQQMAELEPRRRILRVTSRPAPAEVGDRLHIRFTDLGPGIHRKLWDKIFALGFTTRTGGSGLGLFIARSLVHSMEGRISVEESRMPTGTTFLVELPAVTQTEM